MSRVLHRSGAIPPVAVGGEGIYLHLADGTKVIDASGGAAVACLGHGNKRIAAAIGKQAAEMAYAHTGTFISQPAEDLADIILADKPGGLTHAWFCSSEQIRTPLSPKAPMTPRLAANPVGNSAARSVPVHDASAASSSS